MLVANPSFSNSSLILLTEFLCFLWRMPETFSAKKNLGFTNDKTRMYSKKSFPLLSFSPNCFPASLQLWQGGPPITPSISLELKMSFKVSDLNCVSIL